MFDNAFEIMKILNRNGFETRIAGGAVRDKLMGVEPKDVDLATVAHPEQVITIFRNLNFNVIETGLQHGTVTVMMDHIPYEITTLRVDLNTDGRHAEVEFTDNWELDASRRDFTMNAMYMDVDSKIHDYFDGQKHIEENRVEFVGDAEKRIQEDYLRILRFFRFLARYDANTNHRNYSIIARNIEGLKKISKERIYSEISKIFEYNNKFVFGMMVHSNVISAIFGYDRICWNPINGVSWYVQAHAMGVSSKWFREYRAPMDIVYEIEFYENFVPSEIRYDVFKHGKERMDNYSRLNNLTWNTDFEVPKFPLTGHDFMAIAPRERTAAIIRVQKIWANSNFEMDSEELKKVIK